MKLHSKLWVGALLLGLMPLSVNAQVIGPGIPGQEIAQTDQEQAPKTEKTVLKASDLIGMDVVNQSGKELGSIEDLVIDPKSGEITYAAMSVGGFAGVGDKLFAVPFDALDCSGDSQKGETAATTGHVVLDAQPETFQNAEGFDQNNWPEMANQRWESESGQHYEAKRPDHQPEEQK